MKDMILIHHQYIPRALYQQHYTVVQIIHMYAYIHTYTKYKKGTYVKICALGCNLIWKVQRYIYAGSKFQSCPRRETPCNFFSNTHLLLSAACLSHVRAVVQTWRPLEAKKHQILGQLIARYTGIYSAHTYIT